MEGTETGPVNALNLKGCAGYVAWQVRKQNWRDERKSRKEGEGRQKGAARAGA